MFAFSFQQEPQFGAGVCSCHDSKHFTRRKSSQREWNEHAMILLCLKRILLWSIHPCTENLEQSTGWVILEKCRCLLRRQCKAVQLRIYAESISDSLHRTPLTSTAAVWPADPLAQHKRPPWRVKCKGIYLKHLTDTDHPYCQCKSINAPSTQSRWCLYSNAIRGCQGWSWKSLPAILVSR